MFNKYKQLALLSLLSLAMLTILSFSASAQQIGAFKGNAPVVKNGQLVKEGAITKIGSDLFNLTQEYQTFQQKTNRAGRSQFKPANLALQVREGYVVIDAVATQNAETLLAELEKLGLKQGSFYGRIVSGLFPIHKIGELSALQTMQFAKPAYKPRTNVGKVTTQGDSAQRSDVARKQFKVNGISATVGIISDSYNSLGGANAGVASGDLPGPANPNGFKTPVRVLSDLPPGVASDEGRAMAELIHDVAPGAKLAFHTAFNGTADFANGIRRLKSAGCNVIVDDVIYFSEPFFQDGIIAQAVDYVTSNNITYFSAAGNQDRLSYQSAYKPSTIEPELDSVKLGLAHDFGGGDIAQRITIYPGSYSFVLQWSDPYFSVSGSPGAATDLDFYLAVDDEILFGSTDLNIGRDPIEILNVSYDDSLNRPADISLIITKKSGPNPALLKYVIFDGNTTIIQEYNTASSTLYGHANAAGAIAVGAAPYWLTPAYGSAIPRLQAFSSWGGTPILFDLNGNPKNDVRQKPEISAPNGGNTTFFGGDIPNTIPDDTDTFPNFFGTSAAAPQAAGVAALMLDACSNRTTNTKVRQILQSTAIDMLTPGFDFGSGTGLIDAPKAVDAIKFVPRYIERLQLSSVCSDDPAKFRRWLITNPNNFNLSVEYWVVGTNQTGSLRIPLGKSYFETQTVAGVNTVILYWTDAKGNPQVDVKASNGSSCNSSAARIAGAASYEEDNAEIISFSAFPNPFNDKLTLRLINTHENAPQQEVDATFYDMLGRPVWSTKVKTGSGVFESEVDGTKLPAGVYLLRVGDRQWINPIKIVKQ